MKSGAAMQPHTVIQILTILVCIIWPGFMLASLMRADSPSYEPNLLAVVLVTIFSYYPFVIAVFYLFKQWSLFGVPATMLVGLAFVLGTGAMIVSGAGLEAYDLFRGYKWHDLSVVNGKVYHSKELVVGADPVTAATLGSGYWKDKNNVYYKTKIIAGADASSAHVVGMYLLDNVSAFNTIKKLPVTSSGFEDLGGYFVKDNKTVLFGDTVIEGADAPSFRFIGKEYAGDGYTQLRSWAVDKNRVYDYGGRIISGADPKTYEQKFTDDTYIGRDSQHVFFSSLLIPGADSKTFQSLSYQYGKDSSHVYLFAWVEENPVVKMIDGADAKTFELYEPEKSEVANPSKRYGWSDQPDARDGNRFYKNGLVVKKE